MVGFFYAFTVLGGSRFGTGFLLLVTPLPSWVAGMSLSAAFTSHSLLCLAGLRGASICSSTAVLIHAVSSSRVLAFGWPPALLLAPFPADNPPVPFNSGTGIGVPTQLSADCCVYTHQSSHHCFAFFYGGPWWELPWKRRFRESGNANPAMCLPPPIGVGMAGRSSQLSEDLP